jgi:hypothetical protein
MNQTELVIFMERIGEVHQRILKQFETDGKAEGVVDCPCGGVIAYSIAVDYNGHIAARCNSCKVSFME